MKEPLVPAGETGRATQAVVLHSPQSLSLESLVLADAGPEDVIVRTQWSSISSGTERLLYEGRMPPFPGMGYPLVPGYESVGEVVWSGSASIVQPGQHVFVPGGGGFQNVRSLFGAAAAELAVAAERVVPVAESLGPDGVLLALAATARRALRRAGAPDLIIGHGVLGRLLARLAKAEFNVRPRVWERNPNRQDAAGYDVLDPAADTVGGYRCVIDASGDVAVLDTAVAACARQARIVLAGFYADRVSFEFAPAFMKEIEWAIAAEFTPDDLAAVLAALDDGRLTLDGLISHESPADRAPLAYHRAFRDDACLKMVLNWRNT